MAHKRLYRIKNEVLSPVDNSHAGYGSRHANKYDEKKTQVEISMMFGGLTPLQLETLLGDEVT